jgi:hypothetical protein
MSTQLAHAPDVEAPPALRFVRSAPRFELHAAERAVSDLLRARGQDPCSEHLVDTPVVGR